MRTLAFPYTDAMAQPVYCYTFTSELNSTWQDLTRRYTREPQQLPYRDLTIALRFVSGDYATLRKDPDGPGTLLLMRKKIDITTIARLFSTFERHLAGQHNAPFDDRLGPLLRDVRPRTINVAKYLQPGKGLPQSDVPAWVFDVATWRAINLLQGSLKLPDGSHLTLRPDTDGNLVAFDHPLPEDDQRAEQGIHYLSLTPITVPGYPGILLNLDAHISATTGFPGNARSLWIAPDKDGVLLAAKHRYDHKRGVNVVTGMLPVLADSFSITGVPETFAPADLLDPHPRIRARHATTPNRHPIASGPGRKFLDAVLDHATNRLGTESLILQDAKIRNIDMVAAPDGIAAAHHAITTAAAPLHLSVIYEDDIQRARVAHALTTVLGIPEAALAAPNATVLEGRLSIAFTSTTAKILLEPGTPATRADLVDGICAQRGEGVTHIALVQTSKASAGKPAEDPKRQIRRALAARGTVSQFIDIASTGKPDAVDHPAKAAVQDLLRAAGLTPTTPSRVFASPLRPRPCVLVGVYTREQNRPPSRMISLAALVTDGTDHPWRMLGYHPDAKGWNTLPAAIAAHHATDLTRFDDADASTRAAQARAYAERALHQLRTRFDDIPIVVYIDSAERFPLWRGLTNKHLGSHSPGDLPHLTMAGLDSVSIVRVNTSTDGKLIQPVRDLRTRVTATASLVPASEKLYQLPGSSTDTYYLINRSRSDKAYDFGVKAGHHRTRFELGDDTRALRTPWHTMTCTEFVIIDHGAFQREQLAGLGARLCGHPVAWDGRTSRPAPVHLARQVIQDHPERAATT